MNRFNDIENIRDISQEDARAIFEKISTGHGSSAMLTEHPGDAVRRVEALMRSNQLATPGTNLHNPNKARQRAQKMARRVRRKSSV